MTANTSGPKQTRGGAFAAGAARAGGERRRRSGTPLITGPAGEPAGEPSVDRALESTAQASVGRSAESTVDSAARPLPEPLVKRVPKRAAKTAPMTAAKAAPAKVPLSTPAPAPETTPVPARTRTRPSRADVRAKAQKGTRPGGTTAPERRLAAVPEPGTAPTPALARRASGAPSATGGTAASIPEVLEMAINLARTLADQAGIPTEEAERQIAQLLAFVRRRMTGDFTVDPYGFDSDWTEHVHLPVLRLLYKHWFRVEVRGAENLPRTSGALVVANHSGTVALDSMMTQVAVHDETPDHRTLRMLGADLVFQTPFVGVSARRSGSTLAANADAERLLRAGELVGVWPEGFKGIGKKFSERYKLQRFGRGGFVSAALRTGVPIIPCSIVGAEEIYPILGDMPAVARLLGVPFAPITPTFPWLGPLGLIPLPSKWLIEFGPAVPTDTFPPEAADDPMLVFDLTDQVRETIQQTLYGLLMQRKSIFV